MRRKNPLGKKLFKSTHIHRTKNMQTNKTKDNNKSKAKVHKQTTATKNIKTNPRLGEEIGKGRGKKEKSVRMN